MLTSFRGPVAVLSLIFIASAGAASAEDSPPPSDFTVTGSAAVVSQYRFRGLAQSDNKPAVQGAITVSHSSGLYLGTWGSSASAGNAPINIGGTEIDVFGGYAHTFDSGTGVDMGVYGYLYPGATNGNYYELYGSVSHSLGPVSGKVGVYYAPPQKVFNFNFTSPTRHNSYVYGELSSGIPSTPITLHGHLGHTGGGFDWGKPYFDYNVGATYKWKALALDASLVGTDVGRDDINAGFACAGNAGCIDSFYRMGKPVGVVSLTASF